MGELQLDDSSLHADRCGLRSIVSTQLGKDGFNSTLDGFFGDRELVGDLLISIASRDQAKNVDFCRRQCIVRRVLSQLVRGFGRERLPAGMNDSDCLYELLVKRAFEQVSLCSRLESAKNLNVTQVVSTTIRVGVAAIATIASAAHLGICRSIT